MDVAAWVPFRFLFSVPHMFSLLATNISHFLTVPPL